MSASPRNNPICLGLDLGSQSARAAFFDAQNGTLLGQGVSPYESGVDGVLLDEGDPNLARQNPQDYLKAIERAVSLAFREAEIDPERVVGIGLGTTGSTPIPVNSSLMPLASSERFAEELDAQAWMWKDHTAFEEAAEIEALCRDKGAPFLSRSAGAYSSEWYWAKLLHCSRRSVAVSEAAYVWLELQDFVPAQLCGISNPKDLKIGACAAGHKGMYSDEWDGFPDADFLNQLNPQLGRVRERLPKSAYTSDEAAGRLSEAWASRLGLTAGTPVAVGCLDAHAGAVGTGISSGTIVKIMGTSTCDMAVSALGEGNIDAAGLSGAVNGSIIPGMTGLEAGQSAVGDLFEWGAKLFQTPDETLAHTFERLTAGATELRPGESGLLALDWNNGNRSILMDARLSGLLIGQSLQTQPHEIFRAFIEATAFGARVILDQFSEIGASAERVIICGGVASRSSLVRQVYADVLKREIELDKSEHTCALGAAMFGAVVGRVHRDIQSAQAAMSSGKRHTSTPICEHENVYDTLFGLYCQLQDGFSKGSKLLDMSQIMKSLLQIRDNVRSSIKV